MKELEMVVSREVKRRRNRSFYLFPFWPCSTALILLQLFVPCVDATNPCSASQFWVVHADGTTSCEDCGSCLPGRGLSHECGKQISSNAMVTCEPCQAGISFSNKYDTSSCTPCGAPCSGDQVVRHNCTTTRNVKCKKECYSKDRYYDDHGSCLPCSKCCGDNKDVVENECKQKLGAASNMICSFFSSANRCDTTTTAASSAQETTTVINTSRTPVPFTFTTSRDATKTLSASTQQSTITQGAQQSLHQLSKRKQELNDAANVAVIVPVAIIGLLLIPAGCVTYRFLYLRGRCSCLSWHQRDPEIAIRYSPSSSQTWVVKKGEGVACQKSKTIDKVKLHEGITSAESCEPLLSEESPIPRCSHQAKIENREKVSKLLSSLLNHEDALEKICVRLDTVVPGCGHYRHVAQYYGFTHYEIVSVLEKYPEGPTRALIEKLAATHTDLTVEEFATVVNEKTKRNDVLEQLREYDSSEH